ncbi:MAG: hypothetical protein JSU94_16430 [Phycisphaerales bacterium]|nr:MAG: hypothetical protein JSU94_16430 [Phycisphaerales bacterium]
MGTVVFADSWSDFFAEFGLALFAEFFEYSGGEIVDVNSRRNVVKFSLNRGTQKTVFFMKRFVRPHFKDMVFAWRSFGHWFSQARCEWENARFLLDNDIKTYSPVCYGQETRFGLESKSIIVTEQLQFQCLTDFIARNWSNLQAGQKEAVVRGVGCFVRRIHELQVSLPDLHIWHIFLRQRQAGHEYDFAVIDLHRMSRDVTDTRKRINNLGRLYHSLLDKYFDFGLKRLLIESYAGNDWPYDVGTLLACVRKQAAAISARRNPKAY